MASEAHHTQVSEAFVEIRELGAAEQQARLDTLDDAVRAEVVSLLEFDSESPFLRIPPREASAGDAPPALEGVVVAEHVEVQHHAQTGGFGWVYRGFDTRDGTPVAVKLYKPIRDPELMPRVHAAFVREAEVLARLATETTHVVRYRGVGTWRGADGAAHPYIVMDWLDGPTLSSWARHHWPRGASMGQVVRALSPVAHALTRAHELGVAHRDVKTSNVLCVGGGAAPQLRLIDFGAAKRAADRERGFMSTEAAPAMVTYRSGAPEQLERIHGASGPWTDVYALALMVVELAAGTAPFAGLDVVTTIAAITDAQHRPTPRSLGLDVDDTTEALFESALAVDPEQRPQDARTFWTRLTAALSVAWAEPAAPVAPPAFKDLTVQALPDAAEATHPLLGRFELIEAIGGGALGVVYLARDPDLDRPVAVKVLHGSTAIERIRTEATSMARINHRNVAAIYEVDMEAPRPFIAMEHVDGPTLDVWLEESRAWSDIVALFARTARGLVAAHTAGVVHGDVKPSNILIAGDGQPRVVDFGLGHTLAYLAPELLDGGIPSPASDQFSLCVALFEALHGESPFPRESRAGLRAAIARGPRRPERTRVPERISRIVRRGLAEKVYERWPSMQALADALERSAPSVPETRKGWLPRLAFVVSGLVFMVAVALAIGPPARPDTVVQIGWATTAFLLVTTWLIRRPFETLVRDRNLIVIVVPCLAMKQAILMLGAEFGLRVSQLVALDAVALGGMLWILRLIVGLRAFWPLLPVVFALGGMLHWPAHARLLHNLAVGLVLVITAWELWQRRPARP